MSLLCVGRVNYETHNDQPLTLSCTPFVITAVARVYDKGRTFLVRVEDTTRTLDRTYAAFCTESVDKILSDWTPFEPAEP